MDLLKDLNEPQRQAVTHVDGPLLVLAGAGSGKTRVITRRVAYLIAEGVAPWHVLAITFTNKAAGEMRQRVDRLGSLGGATVCTFHSLCARLLREFADAAGMSRNFSIYDRDDQLRLTKEAMARAGVSTERLAPAAVHATISGAKNMLQTPQAFAAQAEGLYLHSVAEVYAEYERLLADNNALDFDDLLGRTVFMLRDAAGIREALAERYRYVLVDEYQDTNNAQYVLAHGIALDHENICVTGDPDQSIYAWRGADVGNILEFESDYPNARVIRLEENYRSAEPILSAANRLIARNRLRKDKRLWTRRAGGADVCVVYCRDERAEARLVARRIHEYRARGGSYEDLAVFYRINSLSRVVEEALMAESIPYRIARGVEFYNRREVKDVLAYLRLMSNPADDLNCLRVVNTPARGIGGVTVGRLTALAAKAGVPLLEACRRATEAGLRAGAARKAAAFAELVASMAGDARASQRAYSAEAASAAKAGSIASQSSTGRPVRAVCEDVIERTGLADLYRSAGDEGASALANMDELVSAAAEFDSNFPDGTLADYLQQVSLVSDVDHIDGGAGAVTLMTLHAAKGLEFPGVFMIACEDGMLPFRRADGRAREEVDPERQEEERRLAFVGMTRAMNELTLTCARKRMLRGRTQRQPASAFLYEIGGDGVRVEDLSAPAPGGRGSGALDAADMRADIEAQDFDLRDAAPVPPEYEHLREGARVHHQLFGFGSVTRLGAQPWPDTRVDVFFEQAGPKRLVLGKANLELL